MSGTQTDTFISDGQADSESRYPKLMKYHKNFLQSNENFGGSSQGQ